MKWCRMCYLDKEVSEFYRGPRYKDGLRPYCKECDRSINRAWKLANVTRYHSIQMDWHRRNKYGVTTEQYEQMRLAQDGCCAICKEPPRGVYDLGVDHDHDTGAVRGLLCTNCNTLLGQAHDDPTVLERAILYVRGYAAVGPQSFQRNT